MADIFISYASADRERARALAERLGEHGYTVWWDRTIPPGRVFDEVIQEALHAARCVVVLWSAESVKSNWVKTEAAEGLDQSKLVPALIEPVLPPIEFKRIQAADLTGWSGDSGHPEYRKLLGSVERLLQQPAQAANAPQQPPEPPRQKVQPPSRLTLLTTMGIVALVGLLAAGAMQWMARQANTDTAPSEPTMSSAPSPAAGSNAENAYDTPSMPAPEAVPSGSSGSTSVAAAAGRMDLIALINGGEIVIAPHEHWNAVIDGKDNTYAWVDGGEGVFAFKEGRAATFDTFAVLVANTDDNNLRDFELLVADHLAGPFRSIGTFATQNVRIMRNPYQEFRFAPVKAKYLKVRALKSHAGSSTAFAYEFQLYGTLE
ncbi:MAG: toll/interleukin-1 receptor domain-containing protein [Burkholderiales bacterium]|nr:toll/interleukin-1 receptor domain-containing protein [Burkholderiales bacterium]